MAALDDEVEMIELLLAQNLSHITIDAGVQPEACSLVFDHGPNHRLVPLHELWTPLHFAAWSASTKATVALLRHEAQVNKPTSVEKWTAVHLAIAAIAGPQTSSLDNFEASFAVIKILVDNGADVNLPKKGGTNAYDLALSFHWHKDLHNLLQSLGAVGTVYMGVEATAPRPRW